MGTEAIVRGPGLDTIEKRIEGGTCIVFSVLGEEGSFLPVRVRTSEEAPLIYRGNDTIEFEGWLPDCPEGEGSELDKCRVIYNVISRQGTMELNLEKAPEAILPVVVKTR